MTWETIALTITFGLVTGILSGLLGVGGGIVMVPYLVLALGQTQHLAEGTSLLVIVPTALVGALSHSRRNLVTWRITPLLAGGGILGAIGGAQLALLTPPGLLTKLFGGFMFLIGLRLLIQGSREKFAARRLTLIGPED